MNRETSLHEQSSAERAPDTVDTAPAQRVDLAAVSPHVIAWLAVAVLAIGYRLIGRANWPLSDGEALIARDAWALLQGNDLSATADSHPVMVQLTALMFFLFGDTDVTARLVPLFAGIGILVTLFWLRSWFGNLPSLSIAVVWAISPVMTMSTLHLDGGAVLVLCSLLSLTLTMTMHAEPDIRKAVILGIALAVGITAHPLGWIVIPLTIFPAMLMIRDFRLGGLLIPTAAPFLIALLVITSWFVTRLTAIPAFFSESLAALWNDHVAQFGSSWQATLVVLLVDEPLLILLGVIGGIALGIGANWNISVHPAVFVSCVAWSAPLLMFGILLDGKSPALYATMLFPLVVVAGLGLSVLLDGIRTTGWQGGFPLLWGAIALGLVIAVLRFGETIARGPEGNTTGWIISSATVGFLVLVPLAFLAIRFTAGTGWTLLPVGLIIAALIVGTIALRTSLLLPMTTDDRPGEILRAGTSTPAVGRLDERLRTYSRDATTYIQDVRDPTGGHGLMIVIDAELSDTFSWYFRDFPNTLVADTADAVPTEVPPDVVLVHSDEADAWQDVLEQHRLQAYAVRYAGPEAIPASTYHGVLLSAVNPLEYGSLLEFMVYRSSPELLQREELVLFLREDHAERVWGTSE